MEKKGDYVILTVSEYNEMLERIEDLSDSVEVLQAELDNEDTMSFEELLKKLKETE